MDQARRSTKGGFWRLKGPKITGTLQKRKAREIKECSFYKSCTVLTSDIGVRHHDVPLSPKEILIIASALCSSTE